MPEYREIECFIAMDASGDIGVGTDEENARTDYSDNVGGEGVVRVLCVKLKVEVPEPTILTATVPCRDAAATLTVS